MKVCSPKMLLVAMQAKRDSFLLARSLSQACGFFTFMFALSIFKWNWAGIHGHGESGGPLERRHDGNKRSKPHRVFLFVKYILWK